MQKKINRLDWVDAWKGILICLVVLGHVVGALYHYTSPTVQALQSFLFKLIYMFHMPAFFVVAGYVAVSHNERESFWNFLGKRARRLLVPYAFFGAASAVAYILIAKLVEPYVAKSAYYSAARFDVPLWRPFLSLIHAGDWPNGMGFQCNSVLWFLPCMFVTLITYRLLSRVITSKIIIVVAMAISFALGGLMRIKGLNYWPWGLSRMPFFLGFVYLGSLLRDVRVIHPRWLLSLLIPSYVLAAWHFPDLGYAYIEWGAYWAAVVLAIVGSYITMLLAFSFKSQAMQTLGIASMGVMLTHKFAVLAVQLGFSRMAGASVSFAIAADLLITVATTAVAYFSAVIIRRYTPIVLGEWRR